MSTYFVKGDVLVAIRDGQGLVKGREYKVIEVKVMPMLHSKLVQYRVEQLRGGHRYWIVNAQIYFNKVSE